MKTAYRLKTIEVFHRKTLEDIIEKTSLFTGVSVTMMRSKSRLQRIVDARHLARYYAYGCGYTTYEIGMALRTDRTNTYNSIKNVFNWNDVDPVFRRRLADYMEFMR